MRTSLRKKSQPKQRPKPIQIPSIKKTKSDDKKTKQLDIKKTGQISYRDITEKRKPVDKKKQELGH